jgi:hypothetical protein
VDVKNYEFRIWRLIFIDMEKLLTPEEKKYLRRVCNYLASLGLKYGEIEFEMEPDDTYLDYDDINWNYVTHFSNNYMADIPSGLIPILEKIVKYASDEELFSYEAPDEEYMSGQEFRIQINCVDQDINIIHYYSWYHKGETNSLMWDDKEGEEIFEEWKKDGVFDGLEIPKTNILTLPYNGSGDSGYIESSFEETSEEVPTPIRDWCYTQLESNFGGWEINEGSDGQFEFHFDDKIINLYHNYNIEENSSDTLWEEPFGTDEK